MAHDVFISYSSRDKAVADAMCASLESKNIRCWIAPRDVPPGQTWPVAIVDAIGNSHVFVLILSNGSNNSAQVLREVGEAMDKGIPAIPFRIEDVIPSKEMGYYLRGIHWLDAITPPLEKHLKNLTITLQALLAAQGAERPPVAASPGASLQEKVEEGATRPFHRTRGLLPILLGLACGLVLGGVIFWVFGVRNKLPAWAFSSVATTNVLKYPSETLTALQAASPPASGATSPPRSQMPTVSIGDNWNQVQSFPAPGNAPTGIVRVDDTLWVAVPCDNHIFHLDLKGNFISELDMPEPGCGPGEVGLAWDGTSLWGTWGDRVIQIDPDNGRAISTFPIDLEGRSLAWDGSYLWVANNVGTLSVYDRNGKRQRRLAIPASMLSGITWGKEELWELDEWGSLTRFDQDLIKVDSFFLSNGCGISSFHQQMAFGLFWDGTSLWVADAVNNRIYQCAPSNR
ncbi:MAG TPA: TIR domain-containing protein [Anaerolineales bacterium]|nr:TIR domain-containing protein [Anaerolineales bacterium]